MKNLVVLKFWPTFFLVFGIQVVYGALYAGSLSVFNMSVETDTMYVISLYFYLFIYVALILWLSKKQNIKIKNFYSIPHIKDVMIMVIIVFFAGIIVTIPLSEPIAFIKSLTNYQLSITSISTRPIFPLLDLQRMLLGPIVEELFFRGFILRTFLKRYPPQYAIILSSLIFGIYHPNLGNLIFYITAGVIFSILYYAHNSLTICTLAHIIWNATTFFRGRIIELDASNSIILLGIYILALYALILMLKKLYRNKAPNGINNSFFST